MCEGKTLMGYTLAEVRKMMDAPLPSSAYKAIPGGPDLTDISPAWMKRAFNSIFGMCGVGWGYDYEADSINFEKVMVSRSRGEKEISVATLKRMVLWFVLVMDHGDHRRFEVPASGASSSEQNNDGWAMKGAITNALSNAASCMGFQESIYLGYRSHKNVKGQAPGASTDEPRKKPAKAEKRPAPPKDTDTQKKAQQKAPEQKHAEDAEIVNKPSNGNGSEGNVGDLAAAIASTRKAAIAAGVKDRTECFECASIFAGREIADWPQANLEELAAIRAGFLKMSSDNKGVAQNG